MEMSSGEIWQIRGWGSRTETVADRRALLYQPER